MFQLVILKLIVLFFSLCHLKLEYYINQGKAVSGMYVTFVLNIIGENIHQTVNNQICKKVIKTR